MGKHDEIVLEITDEKLILLLNKHIGNFGCYSDFHWIIDDDCLDWKINKIIPFFTMPFIHEYFHNEPIRNIKKAFEKCRNIIKNIPLNQSLLIERTFEFPLIKGSNQYKCTKGFIDLIVHCVPMNSGLFATYEKLYFNEFVIEIKKEDDFNDIGAILRQIKEYKEYYNNGTKQWETSLKKNYNNLTTRRFYCILSTKIPENIKDFFLREGIICLELNTLNEKRSDDVEQ